MTENCHFQLFFAFSSKFLEPEIEYCYVRFYTAESRPEGEHLLRISGIFHNPLTSFQTHENRKNCPKTVCLFLFFF